MYAGPTPTRPMTARMTTHQHTGTTTSTSTPSGYYYQLQNGTKGPLPAELITRRPTSSFAPNGTSHARVSTGTGPLIVQQPGPATITRTETKANENPSNRISTPLRAPGKSTETGLQQIDGFNFDNIILDDHSGRSRVRRLIVFSNNLDFAFRIQNLILINRRQLRRQPLGDHHPLPMHRRMNSIIEHYRKLVSIHKFRVLFNKIPINSHIYMIQYRMVTILLIKRTSYFFIQVKDIQIIIIFKSNQRTH